ncbi:methyltransferase domain-containing protein [Alicyclobacillus sp. ALC3]|uniref:methyltransferase domain-containing protein n=1 Tax=Alicyclobacillus sp. ALC3 TaxID=2796143 RepID=UPI0023782207|nr:methyltransferase domain-containing protein [Alicyclobacillus sp. ALC3]WDL96688.1 methyltransferase domain-containing protein [Alicyclobacillus sp. ALC3]
MSKEGHLSLDDFIFIGRTYDEYVRMFDLREADIAGKRILDCPGGACSFAAHASSLGTEVMAADVLYELDGPVLLAKGAADLQRLRKGMAGAKEDYVWDEFCNVDGLIQTRQNALADFIKDYQGNRQRYIAATLPHLPFADNQFDIVLSAHFLFCYAEIIGFDLHLATVKELLRVTENEVRIFPLVSNGGVVYPFLSELLAELELLGHRAEVIAVPYQFQRGASEMLRISKRKGGAVE